MTRDDFRRMFSYDYWANREILHALDLQAPDLEKALRLVAHTLSAQNLWRERLQQAPQSLAVWPRFTIQDCSALTEKMFAAWNSYLDELGTGDFGRVINYRNSRGEAWSSRVEDILIHVLIHSAYHRGQVALEMRAAGLQPAYSDFIHGVRQGLVE